jgi:hypothetical protein
MVYFFITLTISINLKKGDIENEKLFSTTGACACF